MTPLYLYVTRPYAYEIYMGGWRDMTVWTEEPAYYHTPGHYDAYFGTPEKGWCGPHQWQGSKAKGLLRDDPLVGEKIWHLVFWSLLPKGMSEQEGETWWKTESDFENHHRDHNWHNLFADKEWEAKCNRTHKRFLLQVDVRNGTVELMEPRVYLPNWRAAPQDRCFRTVECEAELAIRHKVRPEEVDIPW